MHAQGACRYNQNWQTSQLFFIHLAVGLICNEPLRIMQDADVIGMDGLAKTPPPGAQDKWWKFMKITDNIEPLLGMVPGSVLSSLSAQKYNVTDWWRKITCFCNHVALELQAGGSTLIPLWTGNQFVWTGLHQYTCLLIRRKHWYKVCHMYKYIVKSEMDQAGQLG